MSFSSPCFKKSKNLTSEEIERLSKLPLNMKVVHALMRIQEFYVTHNGKVIASVSDNEFGAVLSNLIKSKYPGVTIEPGNEPCLSHGEERAYPLIIWSMSDAEEYIASLDDRG